MKKKLTSLPIEWDVLESIMPEQHKIVFNMLSALYGGDSDDIINGLMDMTVRAAILAGVEPETFSAGMKQHWDFYANLINRGQQ